MRQFIEKKHRRENGNKSGKALHSHTQDPLPQQHLTGFENL